MTTTENKQIDLGEQAEENINKLYGEKIREEIIHNWEETISQQPELIQKLLADEATKERFIKILTDEGLKELKKTSTATLKSHGGSDNIW